MHTLCLSWKKPIAGKCTSEADVSSTELRTILARDLDVEITAKEAATLITRFDIDSNGAISAEEFARFLRKITPIPNP